MSALYQRVLDHVRGAVLHVEFTTDGREITDYAVVLLLAFDGTTETIRVMTALMGTTRCTDTRGAVENSSESRFMPVRLEKECAPQSLRSSAVMAR